MKKVRTGVKAPRITKVSGIDPEVKVDFSPSQNGQYLIRFHNEDASVGFAMLLRGGLFHQRPEGYVISNEVKRKLDEQHIKYNLVKN